MTSLALFSGLTWWVVGAMTGSPLVGAVPALPPLALLVTALTFRRSRPDRARTLTRIGWWLAVVPTVLYTLPYLRFALLVAANGGWGD